MAQLLSTCILEAHFLGVNLQCLCIVCLTTCLYVLLKLSLEPLYTGTEWLAVDLFYHLWIYVASLLVLWIL